MTDEEKNILNDFAELNQSDFETQLVFMIGREIYADKQISEFTENMLKLKESYSPDFIIRMLAFMPAHTVIKEDWEKGYKSSGGKNSAKIQEKIEFYRCWEDWQDNKGMYKNQESLILAMQNKLGVSRQSVMNWLKEWKTLQKSTNT